MAESASVWRCGRGGGRAQGHERGGVVNQWIARVIGHVAARGAISGRREAGGRGAQLSRHHHVFTCLRIKRSGSVRLSLEKGMFATEIMK